VNVPIQVSNTAGKERSRLEIFSIHHPGCIAMSTRSRARRSVCRGVR